MRPMVTYVSLGFTLGVIYTVACNSGPSDTYADTGLELEVMEVPVGTIVDWYRKDSATALPDGWELADGHTVTDPESPFVNIALPDLRGKFTRGADPTEQDTVGVAGGADTHAHAVGISHSHTATVAEGGGHAHIWVSWGGEGDWTSGDGQAFDPSDMGDGIDGSGGGVGPIFQYMNAGQRGFLTSREPNHSHGVSVAQHTGTATSDPASTVPAYVGFVKIIRVR